MQVSSKQISHSFYKSVRQRNLEYESEIAALKKELINLGEELELSYCKSDKLSNHLSDILDSFSLNVPYDEHLWGWSIDVNTNEVTLSEFGLRIRGYEPGLKLTWMKSLEIIDNEYRNQVEKAISISLTTGADFSMIYMIHPMIGDKEKWIRSIGKVIYGGDGYPIRLEGKFAFIHDEKLKSQFRV